MSGVTNCSRCGHPNPNLVNPPGVEEGMICEDHPLCHRFAAKVLVGDLSILKPNPEEPSVEQGVRMVRIITVNGEMYGQLFSAFSNFHEGVLVADWNKSWKTDWRRIAL